MAYAPVITMQPFRFHSIYQPRIWGGQHMRTMLGRELPNRETAYGEAWEISDRPEAMSTVREGEWEGMPLHQLWEERREELFGPGYERFPRFPLLCKILDARENLSVQVHPPECTAAARRGEVKNEVWYVLHADPDALIYGGMEETATLSDIRRAADWFDEHLALWALRLIFGLLVAPFLFGLLYSLRRPEPLKRPAPPIWKRGNIFTFPPAWFTPSAPGTSLRRSSRTATPPTAFTTGTGQTLPDRDGNCTWNRRWIPSRNSGSSAGSPAT